MRVKSVKRNYYVKNQYNICVFCQQEAVLVEVKLAVFNCPNSRLGTLLTYLHHRRMGLLFLDPQRIDVMLCRVHAAPNQNTWEELAEKLGLYVEMAEAS